MFLVSADLHAFTHFRESAGVSARTLVANGRCVKARRDGFAPSATHGLPTIVILLTALLLAGCGGLSTQDATRLVEAAPQFQEMPRAEVIDGMATRGGIPLYDGLVDLGLVAIHPGPAARVTESGRERFQPFRSAPEPHSRYLVPLVTGRRILYVSVANHARSQAEAEVRWRYDLTDIGQSVANRDPTDQHGLRGERVYRATFTKYDDGWRLEEFASK